MSRQELDSPIITTTEGFDRLKLDRPGRSTSQVEVVSFADLQAVAQRLGLPILHWVNPVPIPGKPHEYAVWDGHAGVLYLFGPTDEEQGKPAKKGGLPIPRGLARSWRNRVDSLVRAGRHVPDAEKLNWLARLYAEVRQYFDGNVNILPSREGDKCRETLVVFPELFTLGELVTDPSSANWCLINQVHESPVCCALCISWRHVRLCFQPTAWENRQVVVIGHDYAIKRASTVSNYCWDPEREVEHSPPIPPCIEPILADSQGEDRNEPPPTCWNRFVAAMQVLVERPPSGSPAAPPGFPELYLNSVLVVPK